jgi:hypothetical protein
MSKQLSTTLDQIENGTTADKVITLKSVFKAGKYTVQPAKDPTKNWFHGIPRLSEDEKKSLEYWTEPSSQLTLVDNYEFDLNDPIQKANWEWVKHLPCVAWSFEEAQKTPSAQFYVYIAGREARDANKGSDLKYKAVKYIMEDSPVNYENRALILGNDLSGESPEEIKKILIETAERQPLRIIAAYEAKNLSIKLLYLRAKQKGVIKMQEGMILFGSNVMGVNEEGCLAFLQSSEHKQILDLLEKEVETALNSEQEASGKSKKTYNFNK